MPYLNLMALAGDVDARSLLLVAAGGALGAMARLAFSAWIPRAAFPWPTLVVNLLGSFLLGMIWLSSHVEEGPRLFLGIGFLGAFTTLSTYSIETLQLWRADRVWAAWSNAVANGLGGPTMAWLGWQVGRLF